MITATVVVAKDAKFLETANGELYYKTIPIVSCILPNPIGPYLTLKEGECSKINKPCGNADVLKQFEYAFYLGIFIWVCWFGVTIIFCFGKGCLKAVSKCCTYTLCQS